jgi:chaperonin cofactor prefoldin
MLTEDDKQWLSQRLGKVETELSQQLEKVETEVSQQLGKVETEFSQRLEKVETTLLTEFHKWASPVELRQRSHEAALRALDAEVESLSDRLKHLEGR